MTVDAFLDLPVRDGLSDLTTDDDFELDLRVISISNEPAIVDGTNYGTCTATCPEASWCEPPCGTNATCAGEYSCYGTCTVQNC